MIRSLSLLGNDSYTNIFSTHPSTLSRIVEVYGTKGNNSRVHPSYFAKIFGLISVLFIIFFGWFLGERAGIVNKGYSAIIIEYVNPVTEELRKNEQYIATAKKLSKNIQNNTIEEGEKIFNLFKTSLWSRTNQYLITGSEIFIEAIHKHLGYSLSQYKLIVKWSIIGFALYILYQIISWITWQTQLILLAKDINRSEYTPIDYILYEAVIAGNVKLAYKALIKGARVNIQINDMSLYEFALQKKQTKIAHFYKRFIK